MSSEIAGDLDASIQNDYMMQRGLRAAEGGEEGAHNVPVRASALVLVHALVCVCACLCSCLYM